MQLVRIPVTGANQFSHTVAITTFLEQTDGTTYGPSMAPRIIGYAYASLGTAATVSLVLSPTLASAADEQIVLETPADAVNNFTQWCGRAGPIVPRSYGLASVAGAQAAPTVALGLPDNAAPYVLRFSTLLKDDDATFFVWYDYVNIGGTL